MLKEISILYEKGWVFRVNPSKIESPQRLLIMLHGWTGSETSMNVFQRSLPKDYAIVSPRGLVSTPEGGYGWLADRPGREAGLDAFRDSAAQLHAMLPYWLTFANDAHVPITLMGFSQGAALALSFALLYPDCVDRVVSMAGFLPYLPSDYPTAEQVKNIDFFLAHGTEDNLVPVARARLARQILEGFGARVQYCEDAVQHRISARCMKEIQAFLNSTPLNE